MFHKTYNDHSYTAPEFITGLFCILFCTYAWFYSIDFYLFTVVICFKFDLIHIGKFDHCFFFDCIIFVINGQISHFTISIMSVKLTIISTFIPKHCNQMVKE